FDTLPPFLRFISTHTFQAGIYRSGTPALTPSALSLPASLMPRRPPLGMAKMRTPGCARRNHATVSTCSRCSLGTASVKTVSHPASPGMRPRFLRTLLAVPAGAFGIYPPCRSVHRYGRTLADLLAIVLICPALYVVAFHSLRKTR